MRTVFACHGATSAGAERTLVSLARAAADRGTRSPSSSLKKQRSSRSSRRRSRRRRSSDVRPSGGWGSTTRGSSACSASYRASCTWWAGWRCYDASAPTGSSSAQVSRLRRWRQPGSSGSSRHDPRSEHPHEPHVAVRASEDADRQVSAPVVGRHPRRIPVRGSAVRRDSPGGGPDIVVPESTTRPHALPRPQRPGQLLSRVVMLGTLSTEKGQLDAVRAIGLLPARCSSVRLDLFGDAGPDDLLELQHLVCALGLRGRVQHHREQQQPARDPACRRRQPRLLAQRGLRPGHRQVDPGRYTHRGIRDGRSRGGPVPGRRRPRRPDASRHGRGPRHAGERPDPVRERSSGDAGPES